MNMVDGITGHLVRRGACVAESVEDGGRTWSVGYGGRKCVLVHKGSAWHILGVGEYGNYMEAVKAVKSCVGMEA